MPHPPNFDGVAIGTDEEEPVVSNARAKLFSSLESFHVASPRFREPMQCGENTQGGGLTQTANIRLGGTSQTIRFTLAL